MCVYSIFQICIDLESLSEVAAMQCGTGRKVDRDSMLRSVIAIRKVVINVDLGTSGPGRDAKWHSQWAEAKLERDLKPEAISEVPRPGLIAIWRIWLFLDVPRPGLIAIWRIWDISGGAEARFNCYLAYLGHFTWSRRQL